MATQTHGAARTAARWLGGALGAGVIVLALAGSVQAHPDDPSGHTSAEQSIVQGSLFDPAKPKFFNLVAGAGSPLVVRQLRDGQATAGRDHRRRSLVYLAQLTDFQLADEESPARVEFTDPGASTAWRPMEAFHPFAIDQSYRQLNTFTDASPIHQGNGARARMNSVILTGDNSDNQQYNETLWVRQLVEGGQTLDPGSGNPNVARYTAPDKAAQCGPFANALAAEAPKYTGASDYDDHQVSENYYDPDAPLAGSQWEHWPRYPGLMDRAQQPFTPVGIRYANGHNVPSYVVDGNHDGLVQGNEDATFALDHIATGCFKQFVSSAQTFPGVPNPNLLLNPTAPTTPVPLDDNRHFVSKAEVRKIFKQGNQADGHGFGFVDPAEDAASSYTAWYYAWDPAPGMRFIAIDTLSEGGVVGEDFGTGAPIGGSTSGNIDDPQFKWLERELQKATAANKLMVLFGHHPIRSMTSIIRDEAAAPCTGRWDAQGNYSGAKNAHGNDPNPGCDSDPRISEPLHLGPDLVNLLNKYPNVLAYVPGHTHENKILACGLNAGCGRSDGGGWWEITTSAVADWPQQNRLIEVMDNRDGTLSIFGLALDHAARIPIPANETPGGAFSGNDLAAVGRNFSYNDPQSDHAALGQPGDRNVELLVGDPRPATALHNILVAQRALRITSFRMRRTPFRLTRFPTAVSGARRAIPRGSGFIYDLSGAANVEIVIRQLLAGRKVGRNCLRPTRARRTRPPCTRLVRRGALTRRAKAGRNTASFSGRIGRRGLAPGRYRAFITASVAGSRLKTPARSANFRISAG